MNVKKLKIADAKRLIKYCKREKLYEGHTYENVKNIELSKNNYALGLVSEDLEQELTNRLKLFYHSNRKDLIVMCSNVITLPKELKNCDLKTQKKFFEAMMNGTSATFGPKNILGGFVHLDETTPHIHVLFTPITKNKFCAKELVNKFNLERLWFNCQVSSDIYLPFHPLEGRKPIRLKNGATQKVVINDKTYYRNKTIKQLKRESEANRIKQDLERIQERTRER